MEEFYKQIKSKKEYFDFKYEGKPLNRSIPNMAYALLPEKIRLNVDRQAITEYLKEKPNLSDSAKKELNWELNFAENKLDRIMMNEKEDLKLEKTTGIYITQNDKDEWMIARQQLTPDTKDWKITYNLAGPFDKIEDAEKAYDKIQDFRETLKGIGTNNLKTLTKMLDDQKDEDPPSRMKKDLIMDFLTHDRKEPKKEMHIEETFSIEYRER